MNQRDNYSDNSFHLLSGLHNINIAKQHFEIIKISAKGEVKNLFNQFIKKCDVLIDNINDRLTDDSRDKLKKELSESLQLEHIGVLFSQMTQEQRDLIENVCEMILKGEKITVELTDTSSTKELPTP